MVQQRLQKILAAAGVASRRKCEELILAGTVCVNGQTVDKLPAFADAQKDIISVDGTRIRTSRKVYFLLNKPKGVNCSNYDTQGGKKAANLIACRERMFCVGKLDADSTGLIILTSDSELASLLTHPRYGVAKTYLVRVKGQIEGPAAERLRKGVWLAEGRTAGATVKILKRGFQESLMEVTIKQGLNRQVRRMLAKVGLAVVALKRTRIGNLTTRGLGIGKSRALTEGEVTYLKRAGRL